MNKKLGLHKNESFTIGGSFVCTQPMDDLTEIKLDL
jgi:hypothetical protein